MGLYLPHRGKKNWGVKEGSDAGYIRHRAGTFLCSIIISLGIPYLGGSYAIFEEACAGENISGNNYVTITYFNFKTVLLERND